MSLLVYQFDTVGSTQLEAMQLAKNASTSENFWVIADVQTNGRGRMGRAWESQKGNLYATLCLQHVNDHEMRKPLPFITGLAVYKTIFPLLNQLQQAQLQLKWPNDVLYAGAKIAGIIVEVHSIGANTNVFIGFGINCTHAPQLKGRAVSCLYNLGIKLTTQHLFLLLSQEFEMIWAHYTRAPNFTKFLHHWQKHALPKGETLRVNTHDGVKIGAYYGLDQSGAMLLQLPNGEIETITAGDVDLLSHKPTA